MPRTPKQYLSWHTDEGDLRPFEWDTKRAQAASMVAEGWPHTKIGAALKIDPPVVSYWRRHPDFSRRVQKIIEDAAHEAATFAIANKVNRIRDLDALREAYLRVFEERQANPTGDSEPGMSSGLVVRSQRITTGRNGTTVECEYKVDNQSTSAFLALHKQAAQEMGQWNQRSHVEVSGGIERVYIIEDAAGRIVEPFNIEAEIKRLDDEENG